jgi:hypothetical protein
VANKAEKEINRRRNTFANDSQEGRNNYSKAPN